MLFSVHETSFGEVARAEHGKYFNLAFGLGYARDFSSDLHSSGHLSVRPCWAAEGHDAIFGSGVNVGARHPFFFLQCTLHGGGDRGVILGGRLLCRR